MRALGTIAVAATITMAGVAAGCGGGGAASTTAASTGPCAQAVQAFIAARESNAPTLDLAADSLAACPGRDEWSAAYRAARPGGADPAEEAVVAALTAACAEADPERLTTTCTGLGPR
jgi:hypothetical protein